MGYLHTCYVKVKKYKDCIYRALNEPKVDSEQIFIIYNYQISVAFFQKILYLTYISIKRGHFQGTFATVQYSHKEIRERNCKIF